jgi:hypothetical protein
VTVAPAQLTETIAAKFAALALTHITREYPHKLEHVLVDANDVKTPRQLHPVFFGSFDWHSCVHGYWLLATLLRRFPTVASAPSIQALFDSQLTEEKIATEVNYLAPVGRRTFERPYGWAWALMLGAELARHQGAGAAKWRSALSPLMNTLVERYLSFLPKATYPVRVGTHFNSAFGIALALEYAVTVRDEDFRRLLSGKAIEWYRNDRDCQAWEPGGDDFLSSALVEAECMRRALPQDQFAHWIDAFLPRLGKLEPATLFQPASVSDRSDGKIVHLDGLNLSRAWCWRSLAKTWPDSDPRRAIASDAAQKHLDASLPQVSGDYMGEHWLATFALLALSA